MNNVELIGNIIDKLKQLKEENSPEYIELYDLVLNRLTNFTELEAEQNNILLDLWDKGLVPTRLMCERLDLDYNKEVERMFLEVTKELADTSDQYLKACETIAKMHNAAMGETIGPKRGVVEDIEDLKAERDRLAKELEEIKGKS
jgi:hypothetical protein